jgi:hypothetical protein
MRLGLIPARWGGGSQRLGPHPVGEAFGKDAADLVGNAHRLLCEGQGFVDASRGQGGVGAGDGEPIDEDEPTQTSTDGVGLFHVAAGGRMVVEPSVGPPAEGESGVEDDLLA